MVVVGGGRGVNAHFAFSPGRNKTGRNRWRSKKEKNPSTAKPKQKVEQHLTRRCLFKSRSSRVDGRRPMNGRRRREKESWLPADGDAVISLFFSLFTPFLIPPPPHTEKSEEKKVPRANRQTCFDFVQIRASMLAIFVSFSLSLSLSKGRSVFFVFRFVSFRFEIVSVSRLDGSVAAATGSTAGQRPSPIDCDAETRTNKRKMRKNSERCVAS